MVPKPTEASADRHGSVKQQSFANEAWQEPVLNLFLLHAARPIHTNGTLGKAKAALRKECG